MDCMEDMDLRLVRELFDFRKKIRTATFLYGSTFGLLELARSRFWY